MTLNTEEVEVAGDGFIRKLLFHRSSPLPAKEKPSQRSVRAHSMPTTGASGPPVVCINVNDDDD